MMRQIFLNILPACLVLIMVSCKKDHSILGVDVQPAEDALNAETLNGLKVTAHTIFSDSVASFNDRYKYFGSNNDPVFGKTDVGLYFKTVLDVSNQNFGSATLSSAEIILAVDGLKYLGDSKATLACSVYRVD